jgi:hypothetical protein
MANEFKIKHGFISGGNADIQGDVSISGSATADNGQRIATRDWSVQYLTDNNYATTADISSAISDLTDSAPALLNTLNELAAALGDDPNFATTVTNSIATKLPLAGGVLSGAINVLYTDSPTGAGWDKNLFIGTSDDLGLAGAFPTYVPSGSLGFFSHANSDGVFIGSVPTAAGSSNYYATIAWGDDATEYFQFLYKGTQVARIDTVGRVYAYQGNSDNWNTAYGWGDHAGLYDTVGSAASEAGAVQDNLDSLAGSLGTLAYSSATIPTNNNQLTNGAGYITGVNWTDVGAGTRTNYDLKFKPATTGGYAGFEFTKYDGNYAGYLLVKGTTDNDVYTANGITLVADGGWLTLAQRTSSAGVRIMTGTTSKERLLVKNDGKVAINPTDSGGFDAVLTVGSGGDGRIQTRHIWGKSSQNDSADNLYVNYQNTGKHVQIGDVNGGNNLYVSGSIYANGFLTGNKVATESYADGAAAVVNTRIEEEVLPSIDAKLDKSGGVLSGGLTLSATAPLLDFVDTNSFSDVNDRFRVRAGGNEGLIQWYDNSSSSLLSIMTFQPNGNVIVPNGNLGIGTTSPGYKLEVNSGGTGAAARFTGTANFSEIYLGSDGVQSQYTNIVWYTNNGNAQIWKAGTGYTAAGGAGALNIYNSNGDISFHPAGQFNAMTIDSNTNVGIGTASPGYKLSVNGDIHIPQNEYIYFDNTAHYIRRGASSVELQGYNGLDLRTAGSSRVFINQAGNVGIGTTSPNAKLHIQDSVAGSEVFAVDGTNGRLFTVTDSLDDSLFSVNTIAGLPVIEAFADNTVKLGPFTNPVIIDSSGSLSIGGATAATQSYVDTSISNLIGGAPGALNTLNELAAALGDDSSFATTITNTISTKLTIGQLVPSQSVWSSATRFTSEGDIGFSGAGNHSLQVFSENGNDAFMAFHISSDHAVYFGLENGTNRLYTGGWSLGSAKHQIWDTRDFTSTNVSNWNTAYGWGNHAGLYLGATAKAADSNLLDGINSTQFVRSDQNAVTIGRHLDANTTWTNSALTLFLGWYGGKVVIGNDNDGGHDYGSALGGNTIPILNKSYFFKTAKFEEDIQIDGNVNFLAGVGTWIASDAMTDSIGWNGNHGVYIGSTARGSSSYVYGDGTYYINGNNYDLWHEGNFDPATKEAAGAAAAVNERIDTEVLPAIDTKLDKSGGQVTGTLSAGGSAAYDSTNLALDVQGNIGIWNDSKLYFKITGDNFNTWSTSQYAAGSTHKFNAQAFSFTNEGYSALVFMNINSSGVAMSRNLVLGNEVYGNSTAYGNWGARLMFNGSNSDAQGNYYIGTNGEDYGGNYSKLDLRWHTGIRMGAQAGYGGIRFFDNEDLNTRIMSIGESDSNIRIDNNLWIGGAGGWITDLLNAKLGATAKAADSNLLDGIDSGSFMRTSAVTHLAMNNYNISGVNHITINDSGYGEGIQWSNWIIYDSPDNLTNASGNLQFSNAADSSIRVTVDTNGNLYPSRDRSHLLGLESNRWQIVYCEILDSAGQHEKNLQNPEGEKSIGEYETGTVLVWKGGKNLPCTEYADHMRMGIAVKGFDSPLVQGAEPVLVTGSVNEGDYLITSRKEGHAEAISPELMRQQGLYDCVLGKALENGQGESHLVKTWINI